MLTDALGSRGRSEDGARLWLQRLTAAVSADEGGPLDEAHRAVGHCLALLEIQALQLPTTIGPFFAHCWNVRGAKPPRIWAEHSPFELNGEPRAWRSLE